MLKEGNRPFYQKAGDKHRDENNEKSYDFKDCIGEEISQSQQESYFNKQDHSNISPWYVRLWNFVLLQLGYLLDYLQYDQVLSLEQFQKVKKTHIIKKKYTQNYTFNPETCKKMVGLTLDEIFRLRQQQEARKQKNCWKEFKRFICCEEANQLDQIEEMWTEKTAVELGERRKFRNEKRKSFEISLISEIQEKSNHRNSNIIFEEGDFFGNNVNQLALKQTDNLFFTEENQNMLLKKYESPHQVVKGKKRQKVKNRKIDKLDPIHRKNTIQGNKTQESQMDQEQKISIKAGDTQIVSIVPHYQDQNEDAKKTSKEQKKHGGKINVVEQEKYYNYQQEITLDASKSKNIGEKTIDDSRTDTNYVEGGKEETENGYQNLQRKKPHERQLSQTNTDQYPSVQVIKTNRSLRKQPQRRGRRKLSQFTNHEHGDEDNQSIMLEKMDENTFTKNDLDKKEQFNSKTAKINGNVSWSYLKKPKKKLENNNTLRFNEIDQPEVIKESLEEEVKPFQKTIKNKDKNIDYEGQNTDSKELSLGKTNITQDDDSTQSYNAQSLTSGISKKKKSRKKKLAKILNNEQDQLQQIQIGQQLQQLANKSISLQNPTNSEHKVDNFNNHTTTFTKKRRHKKLKQAQKQETDQIIFIDEAFKQQNDYKDVEKNSNFEHRNDNAALKRKKKKGKKIQNKAYDEEQVFQINQIDLN